MKVYFSPASPFVRKVMVCAQELGLEVERLPSQAHPVERDRVIVADNPLGQVPTFFADDGTVLYDSRVICEYLDAVAGGGRLFPAPGPGRWRALVEQSLGDGLIDAALLARYEAVVRPAEARFEPWVGGQMDKIAVALDRMQEWAPSLRGRVDIGTITLGCALGYLDFRFPDLDWRGGRDALAGWYAEFGRRPSMAASAP
ncbi:Glutathione S-transferase [Roseomonas rosea]|uniref:glutathione transferase n=1 Tax=Muricoccus roseus TaxID=198092 RepID=A0A1M6LTA5_9PROT|nr:glutathione S-transferase [Roseomonas rosea]SHJ74429.1 Glutathione S-transferase [Roseomonas rosea]